MSEDDPGEYPDGLWWLPWIVKAEKFAYGELNLQPRQFWTLTPAQYNALAAGYYRRRRKRREDEAYWICALVNSYPMRGKNARTLRPEKLIGLSNEDKQKIERKRQNALKKKEP